METLKIGNRLNGYKILKILGRGSQGICYLATLDGRKFALKVVLPEHVSRFPQLPDRAKFLVAEKLQHPLLAAPFEVIRADGTLATVCPYVEGQPLSAALETATELPYLRLVQLALSIATAVLELQSRSIAHGDLGSHNLSVGRTETGLLVGFIFDFDNADHPAMPGQPACKGALHFMAPELYRENFPDLLSERYALSVVLHYVLLLSHPHQPLLQNNQFLRELAPRHKLSPLSVNQRVLNNIRAAARSGEWHCSENNWHPDLEAIRPPFLIRI